MSTHVFIVGTGAMGCLFAARLCRYCVVVMYNVNSEAVQSITNQGVRIVELSGKETAHPVQAVTTVQGYEQWADLVLICTKSRTTEEAAEVAGMVLKTGGLALSLQNGLGNHELLRAVLGETTGVAGVTSQAATVLSYGRVRHAGEGPTYLGGGQAIEHIVYLFNQSGLETIRHDNVESLIWGKLIINAGINALTALLQVPNGDLPQHASSMELMTLLVDEAVQVAHAQGVELPYADPLRQVVAVCDHTSRNRSSMLQDVLRGTCTEIEVINGAIVEKGRELGVATPVNAAMLHLIRALEWAAARRGD